MSAPPGHSWDLTPSEAIALQKELASKVVFKPLRRIPGVAAGCDVAFGTRRELAFAAVAVYRSKDLELVDRAATAVPLSFPYVPGLLSFREAPALLEAIERLTVRPRCLLVDGHGYAHPRRFGIACHLGVLLGLPTVGVAKSILVGTCETPPPERGSWTPLMDRDEVIGAALRVRTGVKPVYVSVGHLVDLESAIAVVLRYSSGQYRIPEPVRAADQLSRQLARSNDPDEASRATHIVRPRRTPHASSSRGSGVIRGEVTRRRKRTPMSRRGNEGTSQ